MANEEQLYILQQGRSTWNTWRQQRLKELIDLYPDLSEADLSRICLSEANLSRAYLQGANLRGANLQETRLTGAKHLTQDQLNTACVYKNTQFPEGLIRPAPCPAKPKAFRTPLDFLAPYRSSFSQPTD